MDYEAPIAFAHFSEWCSGRKSRLSGRLEDFKSILAEMRQENVLEGFTVEGSAEPEDLSYRVASMPGAGGFLALDLSLYSHVEEAIEAAASASPS
jgi:hypothetical protein